MWRLYINEVPIDIYYDKDKAKWAYTLARLIYPNAKIKIKRLNKNYIG